MSGRNCFAENPAYIPTSEKMLGKDEEKKAILQMNASDATENPSFSSYAILK